MTEAEWLACDEPYRLLELLKGKASDRKFRLFAVACCRRLWDQLRHPHCRAAVERGEQFADGLATPAELTAAFQPATQVLRQWRWPEGPLGPVTDDEARAQLIAEDAHYAEREAVAASVHTSRPPGEPGLYHQAHSTSACAVSAAGVLFRASAAEAGRVATDLVEAERIMEEGCRPEALAHAVLLRDIFGDPFRPVTVDPIWIAPTVTALARQVYESRDFSAMPILADALLDAGCANEDVLEHCRSEGPHVRGCWVVDVVPGKG